MSATASTTAKPQESTAVRILKKPITATLLAIVLGFAVAAILLAVAGYDPIASFTALFEGIFAKPKYISNTIIKAAPIILTGISVAVSYTHLDVYKRQRLSGLSVWRPTIVSRSGCSASM